MIIMEMCCSSIDQHLRRNHHRKRKTVTFSDEPIEAKRSIDNCKCNHDDDDDNEENSIPCTWYTKSELDEFKRDVKQQAKKFRILSSKAISSSSVRSSLVLPFANCGVAKKMKYLVKLQNVIDKDNSSCSQQLDFRGLENHIFMERQRNKSIAMKTILEFQHRRQTLTKLAIENGSQNIQLIQNEFSLRLSAICSDLSRWSRDESLALAHLDAEGIFEVPTVDCQPCIHNKSMANVAVNVLSKKFNKRSLMEGNNTCRSKKARRCGGALNLVANNA
mmetsp:Transcript_2242/g.2687  ORF Transcript_2242/g.2687 Transcript_2242/m.2687 type:complete len:276 (+) Transcript_2242:121-948(+)